MSASPIGPCETIVDCGGGGGNRRSDEFNGLIRCGSCCIRLAIARLKPVLEPLLERQSLSWKEALPALELIDSLEEVEESLLDPEV